MQDASRISLVADPFSGEINEEDRDELNREYINLTGGDQISEKPRFDLPFEGLPGAQEELLKKDQQIMNKWKNNTEAYLNRQYYKEYPQAEPQETQKGVKRAREEVVNYLRKRATNKLEDFFRSKQKDVDTITFSKPVPQKIDFLNSIAYQGEPSNLDDKQALTQIADKMLFS